MSTLPTPFFINSNFCYRQTECATLPIFMDTVAQNTGNSYIAYAIYKILFGRPVPLPEIKNLWSWNFANEDELVERINTQHSHVFLALQDQIRLELSYGISPNWNNINRFFQRLKKPFVVFSLGANAFPSDSPDWYTRLQPEFIRFLHILSEHCVSLSVRGEETLNILRKLGITNAKPVGCPTFFETGPSRIITKKAVRGDEPVLGLTCNSYVLQDEQRHIALSYFPKTMSETTALFGRLELADLYADALGYHPCFAGIETWKQFSAQFVFSCFARMHGGILALNAGVPILITNRDLRAREMCQLFAIPYQPGLQVTAENWVRVYEQADINTLNQRYPKLYREFMAWIAEQGFGPAEVAALHTWARSLPSWQEPQLVKNPILKQQVFNNLRTFDFFIPTRMLRHLLINKIKEQWLRKKR